MTLKQLEAFLWAATCANFALAAQRLHISTSSLSKRISELEQGLGVALFDRSAHRATLTEAGQQLLPRAGALLTAVEQTREAVSSEQTLSGPCALGVGELSALTWLPRLTTHMRRALSQVRLHPHVDIGTELQRKLLDGTLDCAIVAGRPANAGIAAHTIGHARFVWVASPRLSPAVAAADERMLRHHPLVTLPPGAGTTKILDDWLMRMDVDPQQRFNCNSWGAIAGLLIEGYGVGILPEGWAKVFQRRKQLRILSSPVALQALTYTFQHRRQDDRRVISAMLAAVTSTANFSIAPKIL